MKVIGVLGGVASGKSLVTEQLRQLGAQTLEADGVGHEVLKDPVVKKAIRERWGVSVFLPDGSVDRSAVARIVFAPAPEGPRELAILEGWVHPRIGERLQRQLDELRRRGDVPAVVLDAAVLLKAGWDRYCNRLLFVECPREQRLECARRRGWSEAEFTAREQAQESAAVKRSRADWIVDNSGSVESTQIQVRQLWQTMHSH